MHTHTHISVLGSPESQHPGKGPHEQGVGWQPVSPLCSCICEVVTVLLKGNLGQVWIHSCPSTTPVAVCLPGHHRWLLVLGEVRAGVLGSVSTSRARGGSVQLPVVPLEAEAEPLPGQANASDSATAGMLNVPARTCPSAGNETPRSSLHPSSSSLPSTFSGGDTRWLSQKPSAKSGPAGLLCSLGSCESLSSSPAPGPQISASSWGAERHHGEAGGCPVWGNPWTDHGKNFQPLLGYVWWWHKEKPAWPWS